MCHSGRYARGRHHILSEGLASFELRSVDTGTEAGDTCSTDGVGRAGHEGNFGANNDQVRCPTFEGNGCQGRHRRRVGRIDR